MEFSIVDVDGGAHVRNEKPSRIINAEVPDTVPGVQPGLEVFHGLGGMFIRRESKSHGWPETLPYLALDNLFSVLNPAGERLFYVGEKVTPTCCYPRSYRPFQLRIFDPWGRLIMEAERRWTYKLRCWGADIFGNDICVVSGTSEEVLGWVRQKFNGHLCGNKTSFNVIDQHGKMRLAIHGAVSCHCMSSKIIDIELTITDVNTDTLVEDQCFVRDPHRPSSSDFGIRLPYDMDCELKAVLLCFMFDIYITYYETRTQQIVCSQGSIACTCLGRNGCTGFRSVIIIMLFLISAVVSTFTALFLLKFIK